MNTGERVRLLRKELNMTLEKFGEKIGMKKNSLSQIENEKNTLTEKTARSICTAYNVNYFWLTKGIGDMFTAIPETIIDEVVDEFKLDKNDRFIIESYLELKEEDRLAVKKFLLSLVEKIKKDEN